MKTLKLSDEQIELVLGALGELPAKTSYQVITSILSQLDKQREKKDEGADKTIS